MNILTTMKQARELMDYAGSKREVIALLEDVIKQIEKAEPVASVMHNDSGVETDNLIDCDLPVGTRLYTYPHDAHAEIERLTKERDEWNAEFKAAYKRETDARQQLAEREGWQKDAERYREIRGGICDIVYDGFKGKTVISTDKFSDSVSTNKAFDSAIDLAIGYAAPKPGDIE